MLTNPIFWVYDDAETTDPLPGTGPFVLQASTEDHTIVMTRNEKHHQGQSRLSALQFTLYAEPYQAFGDFKINKLDYLNQVPLTEIKNIKDNPDYKERFVERYLWETYSLGFNMNRATYAGSYLLRRALNYAVDRNAIIETVLAGSYRTTKGVIPTGMMGYNNQLQGYAYDPEKAKDLLAEAGYPGGEGLKPLLLCFNSDEGHQAIAEAIAQQLNQLGIDVPFCRVMDLRRSSLIVICTELHLRFELRKRAATMSHIAVSTVLTSSCDIKLRLKVLLLPIDLGGSWSLA